MTTFRRILKWIVIVLVVVFAGLQFIRPARTNPAVDESQTIFARTQMPPEVSAIFDRSCRDCHSNKTEWPWYSNVAPVSWWVIDHVDHGRQHFNISEWGRLQPEQQDKKLRDVCETVEDGFMPLSSYLPMHPKAKLSEQDKNVLCEWAKAERARLSSPTNQDEKKSPQER